MMRGKLIDKDLEESGHGTIKVQLQNLPGVIDKSHENLGQVPRLRFRTNLSRTQAQGFIATPVCSVRIVVSEIKLKK
jgi:hypothetical protein